MGTYLINNYMYKIKGTLARVPYTYVHHIHVIKCYFRNTHNTDNTAHVYGFLMSTDTIKYIHLWILVR